MQTLDGIFSHAIVVNHLRSSQVDDTECSTSFTALVTAEVSSYPCVLRFRSPQQLELKTVSGKQPLWKQPKSTIWVFMTNVVFACLLRESCGCISRLCCLFGAIKVDEHRLALRDYGIGASVTRTCARRNANSVQVKLLHNSECTSLFVVFESRHKK